MRISEGVDFAPVPDPWVDNRDGHAVRDNADDDAVEGTTTFSQGLMPGSLGDIWLGYTTNQDSLDGFLDDVLMRRGD